MNNMIRSTWLRVILLFGLVLSAANCGGDSEILIEERYCPALDGFEGGEYLFTVDVGDIADGCASGFFNALIDPGPYGPVTLPPEEDLPQEITMTLPFVGVVTGRLAVIGGAIRLTVEDPIELVGIDVPPFGTVDITARVSGALCPISETRVDAVFTVSVVDINPEISLIQTPCAVGVPGTLR